MLPSSLSRNGRGAYYPRHCAPFADFDVFLRAETDARLAEYIGRRKELLAKRSNDKKGIDAPIAGLNAALQRRQC
jgi:hypothetical protein